MKYVVVILDGASGWPIDSLRGKTTLQAAEMPNLDALAKSGRTGLALTVPDGAEPSSSAACTSILGYDPVADYVGRGAIEAASMGIELRPDQVALRLNLVTITDGIMASYSAGNIATEESSAIVTDIATALDDDTFTLYPGVAYRHILVVSGYPELLQTSYTPPHDISDRHVEPYLPKGPCCRAAARLHGAGAGAARQQRRQPLPHGRRCFAGDRRVAVLARRGAKGARALQRDAGAACRDDERSRPPQRSRRAGRHGPPRHRGRHRWLGQRLRGADRGRPQRARRSRRRGDSRGVAGRGGARRRRRRQDRRHRGDRPRGHLAGQGLCART